MKENQRFESIEIAVFERMNIKYSFSSEQNLQNKKELMEKKLRKSK